MEVQAFDVDKLVNRLEESELFTNKSGTFAKSDFELLMFTIYLDMLTEEPKDYEISVALGIPESKVRNLRLKSQLRYPRKIHWEDEFEKALRKGFYNKNTQTVSIMIEDPAIQNMIKYQIEKSNGIHGSMIARVNLFSSGQLQALMLLVATLKKPKPIMLNEHTATLPFALFRSCWNCPSTSSPRTIS